MIFSYVYYTKIYPKHHHQHHHHEHGQGDNEENHHHHHHHHHNKRKSRGNDNESSPLLNTTRSRSSSTGHGDSTHKRTRRRSSTLTDIALEPEYHSIFIKYILPILFVIGCGTLGFFISGTSGENNSPMITLHLLLLLVMILLLLDHKLWGIAVPYYIWVQEFPKLFKIINVKVFMD